MYPRANIYMVVKTQMLASGKNRTPDVGPQPVTLLTEISWLMKRRQITNQTNKSSN
jgi:hypothetical protein